MEAAELRSHLRFSTAGSVDDGKSTLIGRLLLDSGSLFEDHVLELESRAKNSGQSTNAVLALITDGLKAEREQGITIDVAYRYFRTERRCFILADSPGHEQYTRNMATAASTADLTLLVVDANRGISEQTRRHAFIADLMGVPRLLVVVNKMDAVGYSSEVFESIRSGFEEFATKLSIRQIDFLPASALLGDNVVLPSSTMEWYSGPTVLAYLESLYIESDRNLRDFRFPVQHVVKDDQGYRGYAGQVVSGSVSVGESITVLPSMRESKVAAIDSYGPAMRRTALSSVQASASIVLRLEDEIDIGRGDMIVRSGNRPSPRSSFEAMLLWCSETAMDDRKTYVLQHTTRSTKVRITQKVYRVDINSLSRVPIETLQLNEIARVRMEAQQPIFPDSYARNRATGNFILIDEHSGQTLACGTIIDRLPREALEQNANGDQDEFLPSRRQRERRFAAPAVCVWLTGLSGAGKSTLAEALERRLFAEGRAITRLDGDVLRQGLNRDLGFSSEDRAENIRRVAEVARLLNEAGVSVVCSFISPYLADRALARQIIGSAHFIEVYLSTALDVCEQRDPKGLYAKARSGALPEFTGVSAPYEEPDDSVPRVDCGALSFEESLELLLLILRERELPLREELFR